MRDPNRLYEFYDKLRDIHIAHFPDWRFGQFMNNFSAWLANAKGIDTFPFEEDKMLILINEFVDFLENTIISL